MKCANAFVCYLDLLGTTARYDHAVKADELPGNHNVKDEMLRMQKAFDIMKASMGCENEDRFKSYLFSDCAFLVCETDAYPNGEPKDDNEANLGEFLWRLSDCQSMLIQAGFLVRGFATLGQISFDTNFVSGPVVCEAVREETKVDGPFIGLDEKLVNFVYKGWFRQKRGTTSPDDDLLKTETWENRFAFDKKNNSLLLNFMWNWNRTDANGEELLIRQKCMIDLHGPESENAAKKYAQLASFHNQMAEMLFPGIAKERLRSRFCISPDMFELMGASIGPKLVDPEERLRKLREDAYGYIERENGEIR